MTKVYIVFGVFVLICLAWWFRYDTHCYTASSCVSYDRLKGEWIYPKEIAYNTKQEKIVKNLMIEKNRKIDYKKALLAGYTYQDIIDDLREKNYLFLK